MEKIDNKHFNEERALFSFVDAQITNCSFSEGESPLKESKNIELKDCTFSWKYPLWYSENIKLEESKIEETARSGIWYTDNIEVFRTTIDAPKTFRYAKKVKIKECHLKNAAETLWHCEDVRLETIKVKGDYFGYNSKDISVDNLEIEGNYVFDSCKNVTIRNSVLLSKDSFWNCENVTLINCTIIGEYIGWNTKNLALINCYIESHQGFCYIDGLKMYNCQLVNSDLTFEYCHGLDVEITTVVDSIKNPYDGIIRVKDVKELILDKKFINPAKVKIIRQ